MDLVVMYGICSSTVEMFYSEFLLTQHERIIKIFGVRIREEDDNYRKRLARFNSSEHEE